MTVINIKISAEEKAMLKHEAHQHDMNVSEYLRWLAAQERSKM